MAGPECPGFADCKFSTRHVVRFNRWTYLFSSRRWGAGMEIGTAYRRPLFPRDTAETTERPPRFLVHRSLDIEGLVPSSLRFHGRLPFGRVIRRVRGRRSNECHRVGGGGFIGLASLDPPASGASVGHCRTHSDPSSAPASRTARAPTCADEVSCQPRRGFHFHRLIRREPRDGKFDARHQQLSHLGGPFLHYDDHHPRDSLPLPGTPIANRKGRPSMFRDSGQAWRIRAQRDGLTRMQDRGHGLFLWTRRGE
jgi:hypothetical protein